jgi:hypothetical protein
MEYWGAGVLEYWKDLATPGVATCHYSITPLPQYILSRKETTND